MPGMGPPPKSAEHRARRNASPSTTRLPSAGRSGRAPAWPLGADLAVEVAIELNKGAVAQAQQDLDESTTAREKNAAKRRASTAKQALLRAETMKKLQKSEEGKLWADLWKTPQATQWEKLRWTREVAQYVRHKVKAEAGSLDDAKEARQLSDRLGLSSLALLRLRWEIADEATSTRSTAPKSKRNSSKYRGLKVVS